MTDNNDAPDNDSPSAQDEATLDELTATLGHDRMPDGLTERAMGLLTWLDVDTELAELLDSSSMTGVRGSGSGTGTDLVSALVFVTTDGEWTVELAPSSDRRRVSGTLIGRPVERIEALAATGSAIVEAGIDTFGQFAFSDLPDGPIRLQWHDGQRVIATDWFLPTEG